MAVQNKRMVKRSKEKKKQKIVFFLSACQFSAFFAYNSLNIR